MATPEETPVSNLTDEQLDREVSRLLHKLWGDCKDSPDYHKSSWGRFAQCLDRLKQEAKLQRVS